MESLRVQGHIGAHLAPVEPSPHEPEGAASSWPTVCTISELNAARFTRKQTDSPGL